MRLPASMEGSCRLSGFYLNSVIPAKAGIQGSRLRRLPWMPASAGMTEEKIEP